MLIAYFTTDDNKTFTFKNVEKNYAFWLILFGLLVQIEYLQYL